MILLEIRCSDGKTYNYYPDEEELQHIVYWYTQGDTNTITLNDFIFNRYTIVYIKCV